MASYVSVCLCVYNIENHMQNNNIRHPARASAPYKHDHTHTHSMMPPTFVVTQHVAMLLHLLSGIFVAAAAWAMQL